MFKDSHKGNSDDLCNHKKKKIDIRRWRWMEIKRKKKGAQSARRKHERPRTALMSCRLPFYFSHLQRAACTGWGLLSPACLCRPQRHKCTQGVQCRRVSLNPFKTKSDFIYTITIWQTSAYFFPVTQAPGRRRCDQVEPRV